MITLFAKEETAFTSNGLCVLEPSSCVIKETAGGQYELEMEYPMDSIGKYSMLTEERLIKAPVPPLAVPQIVMPELVVWKTTESVDLYSRTPVLKYKNKNYSIIQKVAANQSAYTWSPSMYYYPGAVVLSGSVVYRAKDGSIGVSPGSTSYVWEWLGVISDGNPTVDSGTVLATLPTNTKVRKIADAGSGYVKVSATVGTTTYTGFLGSSSITETTERYQETIPAHTITEQVFRIYEVSCDYESQLCKIIAKHISYDFARNSMYDCNVTNVSPAEALAYIQDALIVPDQRRIVCDIEDGEITHDWSFKNPLNALLDPDNGLLGDLNARLIRDNADIYLLDYTTPNEGITLEYGVNLLGVNWKRSTEETVTRVIPRSGNSDSGYLYISNGGRISDGEVQDQGKNYVESEIADDYACPIISVLNCSYSVGQEYEEADGTKTKYTEDSVKSKMLTDAKEMFTKDGVDGVNIELDVEFILLGDTEEYKQYKNLQKVNLYDQVTVKTSNTTATAKVTEYEYDSILKRYNSIKCGTVTSFSRRVPGYRMVNESITYEKLAPDLINRIVTENASSSTDSGGSGGTSTGGDGQTVVSTVVDNLNSTSTSSALSANQGRVLNNKIPAVVDNLTSTSTSSALSANQGKVLDEKKADLIKLSNVSGNSSKSYTVANSSRVIVMLTSQNDDVNSLFFVGASTVGALTVTEIRKGSGITITTGTRTLTIQNTTSNAATVNAFVMAGSIADAT